MSSSLDDTKLFDIDQHKKLHSWNKHDEVSKNVSRRGRGETGSRLPRAEAKKN